MLQTETIVRLTDQRQKRTAEYTGSNASCCSVPLVYLGAPQRRSLSRRSVPGVLNYSHRNDVDREEYAGNPNVRSYQHGQLLRVILGILGVRFQLRKEVVENGIPV